ncbi:hypothetical protein SDC9_69245 [bioreactor metagenome]|uniref:Uncharacterized protein n=1 Tax=bioreactor metagenome TaxID=1076179 RepID=A0A644Y3S3_9ZZZZ
MSIVNISTECMQRGTTLFVKLPSCHLGSAQTTTDKYLDTLSTHSHGRCHCHFYGTTVGNTTLYLTGDIVCNNICVNLRPLNFENVDLNLFVGDFLQLLLQFVYLLTTFADYNTGAGSVDCYSDELKCSLNHYFGQAGFGQTCIEVFADL